MAAAGYSRLAGSARSTGAQCGPTAAVGVGGERVAQRRADPDSGRSVTPPGNCVIANATGRCTAQLHGGRARLIAEKLPSVSAKPVPLAGAVPAAPLGRSARTGPDACCRRLLDPFPNGEAVLVENREDPPSRAYLKLYESFVRMRGCCWPQAGETCLDLGASPGGWTWLLAQTGASVVAVDKAPLADCVGRIRAVRWQQASAFDLDHRHEGPVDWLCSDIVCYPQRLLGLVQRWIAAGAVRQRHLHDQVPGCHRPGSGARVFQAIPAGRVIHLHHNRHELTFIRIQET